MRRFAMISPYFPPSSFVGAKRALTFCRNLPQNGWTPRSSRFTSISSGTMIWCHSFRMCPPTAFPGRAYGYLAHQKELNAEPQDFGDNRGKTSNTQGFWKGLKRELTSLPFDRYAKFSVDHSRMQTIYRDPRV